MNIVTHVEKKLTLNNSTIIRELVEILEDRMCLHAENIAEFILEKVIEKVKDASFKAGVEEGRKDAK